MRPDRKYNGIPAGEMKQFLEEKYLQYNNPAFIHTDPVSIPHRFSTLHDREISGFLAATIAWGRRDLIIRSSNILLEAMGNTPYEYIMTAGKDDLKRLSCFVHRTFNSADCLCFIKGLRHIYSDYNSMEDIILEGVRKGGSLKEGISHFRQVFFNEDHQTRTEKHFADVNRGAAGKRLNMFLRWMVRKDNKGVDFGLWKSISPSILSCPLDLHSGNVARKLGLITRKQNDSKAVSELDLILRKMDSHDPVRYDFALFGLGVFEGF